MQIIEVLFLFISRKPSRSRLTNGLKMTLLLSGIMQMAKTTTSKQGRAMLLHGVSLLKHSGMALTQRTKSNAR
jgi:hypothetical protein